MCWVGSFPNLQPSRAANLYLGTGSPWLMTCRFESPFNFLFYSGHHFLFSVYIMFVFYVTWIFFPVLLLLFSVAHPPGSLYELDGFIARADNQSHFWYSRTENQNKIMNNNWMHEKSFVFLSKKLIKELSTYSRIFFFSSIINAIGSFLISQLQ